MTNIEKYKQAFLTSFFVKEQALQTLAYQGTDAWDSVGHMALIAGLEEAFNILLSAEDIIDLNSYKKGMEIMKKYGIDL